MDELPIPSDTRAENLLLAATLTNFDMFVIVRHQVAPEDFQIERHSTIWIAMHNVAARGVQPDMVTVGAEICDMGLSDTVGGRHGLVDLVTQELTNGCNSWHAEEYARTVRRIAIRRKLIEEGARISALGYNEREPERAISQARGILESITRDWASRQPIMGQTAAELVKKQVKPVPWIVPNVISSGFGYLAAKPGMGKTWMLLQWANAIASGGYLFGTVPVERAGKVLFYALEDSEESLIERLQIVAASNQPQSPNLICMHMTSGPGRSMPLSPLDDGGIEQIEAQLIQHEGEIVMVVIDTLTAVAPNQNAGRGNAYASDYKSYVPLRLLAERYNVAIIGTWHYNKAGSVDPMELISGSMGLPAVSVNRMGIVRDRNSSEGIFCSFSKRGRELRWQVEYDATTCQWIYKGDADQVALTRERQKLVDVLEEQQKPMRLVDLARLADMNYNNAVQLVKRMVADGILSKRQADGLYELSEQRTPELLPSATPRVVATG